MSVRVVTRDLVALLTDLTHTAGAPGEGLPTAGILLHTARGHLGDEPGLTDILVGTSTDRFTIGHTFVPCYGQMSEPMLWPIGDVKAVTGAFKPMTAQKDHGVELFRDAGDLVVTEDENLFGGGLRISFAGGDVDEWPAAGIRQLLADPKTTPGPRNGEPTPPAAARTDFAAGRWAPFTKIASRRGEPIQLYRHHQRLPVQLQIGPRYRGVIMPTPSNDDIQGRAGHLPAGDVYPFVPDVFSSDEASA